MNHEGTQQYAFGYGLASTPQIQLQQQQMQLQQHQLQQHQQQQILQHQGNQAISQNLYQLQLANSPTALLQHTNENAPIALAQSVHTGTAQHGIISQPVIQASMSVSLDKSLHSLGNLDAVMYPSQNNGYKIISNSGNFVQQPDTIVGVRQAFHGVDALGKSNMLEGMASQGNLYTFGKQPYSGWMQQNDVGSHHAAMGQSSLPSFSHLWSQFQQQKTHVSIVPRQQQQQQLSQFQQSPQQIHSQFQHHQLSHLQQPQQQFTVSGIQSVPSIQMIKVQPNSVPEQAIYQSASLVPQCGTAPVQLNHSVRNQPNLSLPSNPLPSVPAQQQNLSLAPTAFNQQQHPGAVPSSQDQSPIINTITLQQSDSMQTNVRVIPNQDGAALASSSHSTVRNIFTSQNSIPSSSISKISVSKDKIITQPPPSHSIFHSESTSPDTVKIQTVNTEAFSESGPPKVTVTLDSLTNCQNLSQFPEKEDLIGDLCQERIVTRSEKVMLKASSHPQSFFSEKKGTSVPRLLKLTSSTGSSLDRPSSEDSSFSSPPYSFTPPSSIDSAFSPPPFPKTTSDSQILGMCGSAPPHAVPSPLQPSSTVLSSFLPPAPLSCVSSPASEVSKSRSLGAFRSNVNKFMSPDTQYSDLQGSPLPSPKSLPSTTSSSLVSASCCSNALTTTSVTLSSPQTNGGMAIASVHSFTPLSSPSSVVSRVSPPDVMRTLLPTEMEHSDQKLIKVPYSWERKLLDGVIVYLSPSQAWLTSLEEIRDYLLSDDTCKCGLECPVQLEKAFNFDVTVENQPWEASPDNIMKFCRHRRDIMAVAAFHQSQTQAQQSLPGVKSAFTRKRESKLGSGEGLIVAPPKRLKKSITKAVNKHALSLSSSCVGNPTPLKDGEFQLTSSNSGTPFGKCRSTASSPMTVVTRVSENDIAKKKMPSCTNNEKGPSLRVSTHHHSDTGSQVPITSIVTSLQSLPPHSPVAKTGDARLSRASLFNASAVLPEKTSPIFSHDSVSPAKMGLLQVTVSSDTHFTPVSSTPSTSSFLYSGKNYLPTLTTSSINSSNLAMSCTNSRALNSKLSDTDSNRSSALNPTQAKSAKMKSKNSKGRREKQLKTPSATGSVVRNKNMCLPSSTVSFLENPTVFVAQQTAIINNSIASCKLDCASPERPGNKNEKKRLPGLDDAGHVDSRGLGDKKGEPLISKEDLDEAVDELDTSKEEEDNKACTDVESNKSFSDTTENNDSAYLSQTGSDQEKSDTVDGMDCSLKSSDIYDFNSSEDHVENTLPLVHLKNSSLNLNVDCAEITRKRDKRSLTGKDSDKVDKDKDSYPSDKQHISSNPSLKSSGGNAKLTALTKPLTPSPASSVTRMISSPVESKFCEDLKMNWPSSLNGDLSQLLASGNWNIPALQKVLAKHSAGDPNGLNTAIQQVLAQVSNPATQSLTFQENVKTSPSFAKKDITASGHGSKTEAKCSPKSDVKNPIVHNATVSKAIQSGTPQNDTASSCGSKLSFPSGQSFTGTKKPPETPGNELSQTPLAPKPPLNMIASGLPNTASSVLNISIAPNSTTVSKVTTQCSPHGSAVMLNSFSPHVMSVNTPMPPVSMSIVSNVTKSVTQVIPNLGGFNQTVLGTQQFLNTRQNPTATAQFVNAAAATQQGSHLVSPSSQGTQLMNAISIPGLNTSLVIANPIQQASPSNSVTQLSPAIAGQILAQSQQPLQQMSPSFVPAQIPKQVSTSVITNHNACTSSTVSLTVNPNAGEIPCSVPQGGIFGNTFHKSPNVSEIQTNCFENKEVLNLIAASQAPSISQSAPNANPSLYPAGSQSLFVIPQAKATPVMQLLSSSQTLNPAPPRQADVAHLLNQTSVTDQNQQLQNLIAAGFNPLAMQQAWNTVSLGAQQQQQQQLQLLQLQQLMFPLIQSQNQNLSGVTQNANQATGTLAPQTLMNAVVAQQNLQLNQVVDMKAIQQNLSPVAAQGYVNPALSPVAQGYSNTIQQMPSPITVHQVSGANPNMAINPQGSHLPNTMSILPSGKTSTVQTAGQTDLPSAVLSQPALVQPSPKADEKVSPDSSSQPLTSKSTPSSTINKAPQPTKSGSKSKSKSKKSDGSKTKDPQASKDEEHIATAVQQILAQAVQQQRELNLAAKNQPPPPPKSRSRKRDSQARARNAQANKELELGKLASISDDAVEKTAISFKAPSMVPFGHPGSSEIPFTSTSLLISPSQQTCQPSTSSQGFVNNQPFHHPIQPTQPTGEHSPGGMPLYNSAPMANKALKSPTNPVGPTGGGEQASGESTGSANPVSKKNNISLREHLSSIIFSKDKENGKKKQEKLDTSHNKAKAPHSNSTPSVLMNGETSYQPTKMAGAKNNHPKNDKQTIALANGSSQ